MKKNIAIKIVNLSKTYVLNHERPTLAENFLKTKKEKFMALKNINLEIKKGERLGIIGSNGAGKSTLLKIICGITIPTMGEVKTVGKIASLIDLEAGFEPELNGEENIYINGLLLGISKSTIKEKMDQIVEFSGIRKFIDTPLYTYSSGMKIRVGFSIAIHSDPDILAIDEVIAAVDNKFAKKANQRLISDFYKRGKTIIFVSHNLNLIQKQCSKVLWLEKGKIRALGLPKKVISQYLKS